MTRHHSQEERLREILDAATTEIEEHGYAKLTMEAIISRTSLSKGGVYRFFSNKHQVALALFRRIILRMGDFDVQHVLQQNLPLDQTLMQLLLHHYGKDAEARQDRRLWLQLLPEITWNADFAREREQHEQSIQGKYRELVFGLVERDNLPVRPDFAARIDIAIQMGSALVMGCMLMALEGTTEDEIASYLQYFLEVLRNDINQSQ